MMTESIKPNCSLVASAMSKLFQSSDLVYVCGPLATEGDQTFYTDPRLIPMHKLQYELLPQHNQFCINPINPIGNKNPNAMGSRRHSSNIVAYRNFLLESDTIDVEIQKLLIPLIAAELPLTMAIYSGSKSVHYIFSVADTLNLGVPGSPEATALYKQLWGGLCDKVSEIVRQKLQCSEKVTLFDESTKDSIRLARLPFGIRNNNVQEVLYNGVLGNADELVSLVTFRDYVATGISVAPDPAMSLDTFERKLKASSSLQWLRLHLEDPSKWVSNANMYFKIFKYSLWAIDGTGVPYDTLNLYLQKTVFPAIVKAGYPRDPAMGLFNAYRYKGLK